MNNTPDPGHNVWPFKLTAEKLAGILFWVLAVLLLFLNLGIGGLRGSEGRWADVVRLMILNGDYLHPMINYEAYFDKPLVSYWLIAGLSLIAGSVTELMIRLPSAAAGLVTLWATRLIASRFAGRTTGIFAGWILLTAYSFAYWGRLGEADMLNLAFSTLAVGWYVVRRDKTDFGSYLLFGLLCAVGGQTKGLSAVAVPVLAVLADIAVTRSWKRHLNWKLFAAGLLSLAVYLLPFLLASAKKDYEDSGLALVFQENIQRYFDSLDHKQAWYAYFIHLPQLMMPWTPILILAIIASVRNWKKADHSERWILVCIAVIFAVFSISDSKRVYYILPILPYCSILCAVFLLSETAGILEKIRNIVLKVYFWLIPTTAAALLGLTVYGYAFGRKIRLIRYGVRESLQLVLPAMLLTALILLVIWTLFFRKLDPQRFPNREIGRDFAACAGACAVLLIAFFGITMPLFSEMFRTEKPFFGQIVSLAEKHRIPKDRIYFFHHNYTNGSFYLKHEHKIPVLDHEDSAEEELLGKELAKLLKESQGQRFMVIGQLRYFRKISSPELRQQILDRLNLIERSGPAENPKKNGKKYAVLISPAP